jgi:cytochrome P450
LRFFLTKIPGTADWVQETSNRKLVERLSNLQARRKLEVDDHHHHKITRIDALSLLLTACQANAASRNLLQDNFVSGLTYELLLAGSETTATTLSFAIYNISGSERVEEKLLQEIDAYGPIDSKVGLEDLDKKFPYVEQVSI